MIFRLEDVPMSNDLAVRPPAAVAPWCNWRRPCPREPNAWLLNPLMRPMEEKPWEKTMETPWFEMEIPWKKPWKIWKIWEKP